MLTLVLALILYVAGFVFLYGVLRLSVRHALEDLEARRSLPDGQPRERPYLPASFIGGN